MVVLLPLLVLLDSNRDTIAVTQQAQPAGQSLELMHL
jgi:hypothetical protein